MIKIIDLRCGKDSDIFENLASRSQLEYRDVLDRVEEIVANVRRNGDKAVLEYTAMFDKVQLTLGKLRVTILLKLQKNEEKHFKRWYLCGLSNVT